MAEPADFLVIGGGIAGLSAGAALALHGRVLVLEAEAQTGAHSSGRSATMFHYALGNPIIRAMTQASRALFDEPPAAFDSPPAHRVPLLVHAREDELDALARAEAEMAPFTTLERLDAAGLAELCPVLKTGPAGAVAGLADRTSLRIDPHALMQGLARTIRRRGGQIVTSARVAAIKREDGAWSMRTEAGASFAAPLLVNAAGAWADGVARLAGVRPLGLTPLRRTIITFDAPPGIDPARLPFAKTATDALYFSGESGRLFASPMDEGPTEPCDCQPDELDVATAAHRMEERTIVEVRRIHAKWSGLRTFAPDRTPELGFAPDADGFFWCAGQGGAGLQTAPAAAAVVESLITGGEWPLAAVPPKLLAPARFLGQPA